MKQWKKFAVWSSQSSVPCDHVMEAAYLKLNDCCIQVKHVQSSAQRVFDLACAVTCPNKMNEQVCGRTRYFFVTSVLSSKLQVVCFCTIIWLLIWPRVNLTDTLAPRLLEVCPVVAYLHCTLIHAVRTVCFLRYGAATVASSGNRCVYAMGLVVSAWWNR